ncbi:MAG: DUF5320 domain-containing protein [Candidatus Omnitrophota bacterium]
MPGFDGTGPMGAGAMTGGGRGYCVAPAGNLRSSFTGSFSGRCGRGRGFGRGYGFRRAGYSNAYGNLYAAPSYPAAFTPKQEADMLKAEARAMQGEIDAINQRVKDLESAKG